MRQGRLQHDVPWGVSWGQKRRLWTSKSRMFLSRIKATRGESGKMSRVEGSVKKEVPPNDFHSSEVVMVVCKSKDGRIRGRFRRRQKGLNTLQTDSLSFPMALWTPRVVFIVPPATLFMPSSACDVNKSILMKHVRC
jgi:hypothetical protein